MRLPQQSDPIVFVPRVPYNRQGELTGFITRVWDAEKGDVDLIFIGAGAGAEWQTVNHAVRRSDANKVHCWDFAGNGADQQKSENDGGSGMGPLMKIIKGLQSGVESGQVQIDALQRQIDELREAAKGKPAELVARHKAAKKAAAAHRRK